MFSVIVFLSCSFSFAADGTNNNIDSDVEANSPPKTLSQSNIISAANSVKNYANKNGKLPDSVTISGYKFSMPEFTYLLSKTIENQHKKSNSKVTVKYNIKNPSKPSGTNINTKIHSKNYRDYAVRTIKFIDKYNQVPNYINALKASKIQYQTSIHMFSSVLSYTNSKKKLPSYVTVNIKSSNSINKYVPNYVKSSQVKKISNNNAIWVQSKSFNSVNFNTLANSGIKNIFLHEFAFTQYGKTAVTSWMKSANSYGIKVHIWIQTFYENGKWVNPIDIKTETYNQSHFNKVLSKIKTYSKMNYVSGIHLDYLRYPGTAYKYSFSNGITGENAVTEFTKQAAKTMNSCNPSLILSAAVMPETNANAKYYGQNIPVLGKYLDVITPMIYKGNYRKDSNWITATTNWFVKNSGGAKIWGGIQTYKSDNNLEILSTSELKTDSKAVIQGGASGIALFRWGLTNFIDLLSI
ncbi:MAG: putative glycoside hydrolase [Methanobacteriaceae archaeon]|nr:putative glycoside hydrolase [Candidatus Methanorudis spinitermitis]